MQTQKDWRKKLARFCREARGELTKKELAAAATVSVGYIDLIETGQLEQFPPATTIERLAVATGRMSSEWFFALGQNYGRDEEDKIEGGAVVCKVPCNVGGQIEDVISREVDALRREIDAKLRAFPARIRRAIRESEHST